MNRRSPCSSSIRFSAAILLTFIYCLCDTSISSAVDFETIEKAWRDREAQTPAVTVRWTETNQHLQTPAPGVPIAPEQHIKLIPQLTPNAVMFLGNSKGRYETTTLTKEGEGFGTPIVNAFNGKDSRQLLSAENLNGVEFAEKRSHFASQISAWPVLLFYRGCDELLLDCPLALFEYEGENSEDEERCVKLKSTNGGRLGAVDLELWVRTDLNYAPVRLSGKNRSGTTYEVSMDLAREKDRVALKGWSTTFAINGKSIQSTKVSAAKVGYETIDPKLFDLVFSDGTLATDMRPTAVGGEPRMYLVVGDKEREITRAERLRGVSIDELRQTETGKAGLPKKAEQAKPK